MTQDEAERIDCGLYLVYWEDGSRSVAAVGMDEIGRRWIAPTNWLRPGDWTSWTKVKNVEPIDNVGQRICWFDGNLRPCVHHDPVPTRRPKPPTFDTVPG